MHHHKEYIKYKEWMKTDNDGNPFINWGLKRVELLP